MKKAIYERYKAGLYGSQCIPYIAGGVNDAGMDIFERGLCLPSDIKMSSEEQDIVIEIVKSCFEGKL